MNMNTAANNGLDAAELGETSHNVFHRCLGDQPYSTNWHHTKAAWMDVAVLAISIIDLPPEEQAVLEVSAKELAERLYLQFCNAMQADPDWQSMDSTYQLAWEAVGRHLANCIDADSAGVNVGTFEGRAVQWFETHA